MSQGNFFGSAAHNINDQPSIGVNRFFINHNNINDTALLSDGDDGGLTNFYLTLLFAGVNDELLSDDMLPIEDALKVISFSFPLVPEYWCAVVLDGRYEMAAHILSEFENDLSNIGCFQGIKYILPDYEDFIDYFTDNGRNENYSKLLLNLFAQDYIYGGELIYRYVRKYSNEKELSDSECLDRALLSIGSADNVLKVLNFPSPYSELASEHDRLAAGLMCRCAELGMKLNEFHSFLNIFINVPLIPGEEIPEKMTDLISPDTKVSLGGETCMHADCMCFIGDPPVYADQMEYIAMKFRQKYNCRLNVTVYDTNELTAPRDWDNMEITLPETTVSELLLNHSILQKVIRKNILSADNIESLIRHSVELSTDPNYRKKALKALSILNTRAKT